MPRIASALRRVGACFVIASLVACNWLKQQAEPAPEQNPSYPVLIRARRDDQMPVAGVQILLGKTLAGTTDASGSVRFKLKGNEGDTVPLSVKCPEGYASPEKSIVVGLRRMASGSPPPEFETQCVPLVRSIVVGLRAENGANLPIRRLNQVIGQTDGFGVAHLLLQASPQDQVTLTLDTSGSPALRPQNPTLTFVVKDHDELVLLDQKFTVQKKVIVSRPKSIPRPL